MPVICSDERKLDLFDLKDVWRKKGELYDSKNTVPTVNHGGGSIMLGDASDHLESGIWSKWKES